MYNIHFRAVHDTIVICIFLLLPFVIATSQIPLQDVVGYDALDDCVRSCATSISSAFSSNLACPSLNPAPCLCNGTAAVSSVAGKVHVCASRTCTAYPSDAEKGRGFMTTYCQANSVQQTVVSTAANTPVMTSASSTPSITPPSTDSSSTNRNCQVCTGTLVNTTSLFTWTTSFHSITSSPISIPTPGINSASKITTDPPMTTSSTLSLSKPGWTRTGVGIAVIVVIGVMAGVGVGIPVVAHLLKKRVFKWMHFRRSSDDEKGNKSNGRCSIHQQPLLVEMKNGKFCECLAIADSGSRGEHSNFVSIAQIKKLGFDETDLKQSTRTWTGMDGRSMLVLGSIKLTWKTNRLAKKEPKVKFYVSDSTLLGLVLGAEFCIRKGVLVYNPAAWIQIPDKKPSKKKDKKAERERKAQAVIAQTVLQNAYVWTQEGDRYFRIDESGRKVYYGEGEQSGAGA